MEIDKEQILKAISNYEKALNEKVSLRTVELLVKLYLRNGNDASADNVIQKYLHIRLHLSLTLSPSVYQVKFSKDSGSLTNG